eukprot:349838-Chlamydomonas_euryale.AAC.1
MPMIARVLPLPLAVQGHVNYHPDKFARVLPLPLAVQVHVNYHPDKFARMQSIWAHYVDGDVHALDKYPVGSCFNAPNC